MGRYSGLRNFRQKHTPVYLHNSSLYLGLNFQYIRVFPAGYRFT